MLCASFVVQSNIGECFMQVLKYKVVLGSALRKLCSTKQYWGVLCASFEVQSSTGGSALCKLCNTKYFVKAFLSKCIWEKSLLRWHVRRDGMRWEELRWGEKSSHSLRRDEVWSVKCEVWSAGCEERSVKCEESAHLALHCAGVARAQVILLDNNSATDSHKARTHGPGWRRAHASSIDEKGLII